MASWLAWGQHAPQDGDEPIMNDNYRASSFSRPSRWQQSQQFYSDRYVSYGADSASAIAQRQRAQGSSATAGGGASGGASGGAQTFGYSTSLQGVSASPSTIPASRSQLAWTGLGLPEYGAGAAIANNHGLAASGLSTQLQTSVQINSVSVSGASADPFAAFYEPAYQDTAYGANYSAPNPPLGSHCLYGDHDNLYIDDFGNATNASVARPSPPPQHFPLQPLPSSSYQPAGESFHQIEYRQNEFRLNQESRLIIANRPFVEFAPANDDNSPPADVSFHQRLPEHVTLPHLEHLRLPQLTAASSDYALYYNRAQANNPEANNLGLAEGLATSRLPLTEFGALLRDRDDHFPNGNIQGDGRQEEHIPAEFTPGEWIARRDSLEDNTNDESHGHNSASLFCGDHDLAMPSQARSLTPRESGASRKRARPSLDAVAGPSRQKKSAQSSVSVANRAAARVSKVSCQTPAAGLDKDDPFNVKDDEDKKIDMVDMTADDNIPDELQILPDPPSTKLSKFECIICLDTASTLTVTHCGHMFCGSCLYQALHAGATKMVCPMCRRQKLEHRKWDAALNKSAKTLFHLELKVKQTKRQGKQPLRPPQRK